MKRFFFLILGLCLVLAASPALAGPVKGGHLRVCQPAEPPGLDPTSNAAAAIDRVVYANILEGLIKVNGKGELIPGLAEKWDASEDGKVYTFHLRKGVKFHNGEDFNAEVAKFSLDRARAKESTNAHPEYLASVETIDAKDPQTLILTLKDPDAMLLERLATGDLVIVPKGAVDKLKSEPIGTGPFKFVKWNRGQNVVMERFEGYWNPELPYLDKVTHVFIPDGAAQVANLKAGDVDVIGSVAAPEMAAELAKDPRFKVINGSTTGETIMSTNNKAKPFDDLRVRQAMAHAIDRQTVIDLAMSGYGIPIGSHWSPSQAYYEDLTGTYPYDPEKAKKLLAEAGYPNGFEAVIKLPSNYQYSVRCGTVIADMLSKVGIKLKIEEVEWGQWIEKIYKNKEYQLTVITHVEAWDIGIYAKPDYYFQYDSKEFQDTYAQALKAKNEEEKASLFKKCQEIIAKDAVNYYIMSLPSLPAMKKEVMGWWENYPAIALDCTEVWLQK